MGLTGVIYAAIVAVWIVVLVPLALRRHDQAARSHSIERFSSAMRVLARRGPDPVSRVGGATGVVPDRRLHPARTESASAPTAAARRPSRAAVRAAARRRRRVLAILLVAAAVVAGVAALGYASWYAVAVPVALSVCFLCIARRQVRRAADSYWQQAAHAAPEPSNVVRRDGPAVRVDASHGAVRVDAAADEETVGLSREELARAARVDAVAYATSDGRSLWDPLPVTLPTYVDKPAARRSVRTIDLDEPGVWSAGHSTADSRAVAASEAAESSGSGADERRAANA